MSAEIINISYTYDGLQNFVSGVGTQKDKSSNWTHVYEPLTRDQVDAIYSSDWLARKIVDIVAYDMTREWRTWLGDDAEEMYAAEKELRVRTQVRKALTYARLYGGSAIMIGDGARDPAKPLVLDRMGKGALKYLHVFTRDDLEEVDGALVEDVNSPDLGKTMLYRLRDRRGRGGNTNVVIHRSRLAFFCGPEAPADQPTAYGWGHSVYDSVLKAVVNVNAAAANAAAMTEEAKIDVITIPDLHKLLMTDGGTQALLKRWALANTLKSTVNTLLIGNGEEFTRKEMNFGGLPDLIRTHLEIVSGAADVPLTRLLGQSPAGLNATGESDIRNYYDMLKSRQTTELEESLWPLDQALKQHVTGTNPEELVYEWVPLWQLSESERADIAQKKMAALVQLAGLNLFAPEELRPAVFDSLMQDGFLATLDAHLLTDKDFEEKLQEEAEAAQAAAEQAAPPEGGRPQLRVVGGDADPFEMLDTGFFEESEHPRGHGGKFSEKAGGFQGYGQKRFKQVKSETPAVDLFDEAVAKEGIPTAQQLLAMYPKEVWAKADAAEARIKSGRATIDMHTENGVYTPERQKLHAGILKKLFSPEAVSKARPKAGQKPKVVFLGGRGGSGKSWLWSKDGPVNKDEYLYINSDDVKELLPEYEGWNAALLHEEAADIVAQADEMTRRLGLNVIHDATLRTDSRPKKLQKKYMEQGYEVHGYYMFASPMTAATRAVDRFLKSGRYVPPNYSLSSLTNEVTFDRLKDDMTKWAVYSSNDGFPPKLVSEGGK